MSAQEHKSWPHPALHGQGSWQGLQQGLCAGKQLGIWQESLSDQHILPRLRQRVLLAAGLAGCMVVEAVYGGVSGCVCGQQLLLLCRQCISSAACCYRLPQHCGVNFVGTALSVL